MQSPSFTVMVFDILFSQGPGSPIERVTFNRTLPGRNSVDVRLAVVTGLLPR